MTKICSRIEVNVPIEKLIAFLGDWHNAEKWYEGIYDWKPITEYTMGNGARFSYKVKELGIATLCEAEMFDYVKNMGFKFRSVKGPKVDEHYSFDSIEGGTRINYTMAYDIPLPLLGRILDTLIFKSLWAKRVQRSFQNLKRLLES